tara:strand:- start:59 stop:283 length:225 start_codon:yes stop_codon:yes gene_type:complete
MVLLIIYGDNMVVIKLSEYYSDDQTKKARIDKVEDRYKLSFYVKRKLLQTFFMDNEDTAQIVAEDWVQGNVRKS